jgi:dimethylhistidine N-methyltransferase
MSGARQRAVVAPSRTEAALAEFAGEVRFYLSQRPRQLPSRFLYDALGSALFEAITRLPWYRVTRAELGLLRVHARDILNRPDAPARLVELGSGSGEKLAALLDRGSPVHAPRQLHLIDVSPAALAAASLALAAVVRTQVVTHEASYEEGLERVRRTAAPDGRTLVAFLGSNIGNFEPDAARDLLAGVRRVLRPGDELLIGVDMVKPERELMLAYDDPLSVTAAFNRNLLVRLNRELDADIDLAGFRHAAVWNAGESRVEMHLVSTHRQRLRIPRAACDITLQEGETIWTESSYKFDDEMLARLLADSGFTAETQWLDRDARFALTLARA